MGVWIETLRLSAQCRSPRVTPHVGVWIETTFLRSKPAGRRVTPHVGVWIETAQPSLTQIDH